MAWESHQMKVHETSEAAIVRHEDTKTTIYEVRYLAKKFGIDAFTQGFSLGVGVCVNDGDTGPGQGSETRLRDKASRQGSYTRLLHKAPPKS